MYKSLPLICVAHTLLIGNTCLEIRALALPKCICVCCHGYIYIQGRCCVYVYMIYVFMYLCRFFIIFSPNLRALLIKSLFLFSNKVETLDWRTNAKNITAIRQYLILLVPSLTKTLSSAYWFLKTNTYLLCKKLEMHHSGVVVPVESEINFYANIHYSSMSRNCSF